MFDKAACDRAYYLAHREQKIASARARSVAQRPVDRASGALKLARVMGIPIRHARDLVARMERRT